MWKMSRGFFLLSIVLIWGLKYVTTISSSTQDVGRSCSRTNETVPNCNNYLNAVYVLMKEVRVCKASLNDRDSQLCNVIKRCDEQQAAYNSTVEAQEKFNTNVTEQLMAYRHRIELQETIITKITEKFETLSANSSISKSCQLHGNAIHTLKVPGIEAFSVSCDARFAGPGWIVILRREDDSVDFNRDWSEYRDGFGNLNGNFWLGLDKIHHLTASQPHELYVHIKSFESKIRYARYDAFEIGNELGLYELSTLGNYTGNADDGFRYHEKKKFTTWDRDNDEWYRNCADQWNGGWWYRNCSNSFLTVPYKVVHNAEDHVFGSMYWLHYGRLQDSIKFVQMMIRPKYS